MELYSEVAKTAYFLLPAYFANMAPVIWKPIFPWLDHPIDGGLTLNSRPLLGRNKTWRGLVLGILTAMVVAYIQYSLSDPSWLYPIGVSPYLFGAVMGFGALFGDALKSMIKRQAGIAPGKSWPPYDQMDFTVGAFLVTSFIFMPGILQCAIVVVGVALGHVLIKSFGRLLGLE